LALHLSCQFISITVFCPVQDARAEELTAKAKTISDEADIAQAKKEQLWEAAKGAGEGADKTSDRGYVKATEAVGAWPHH